MRLKLAHLGSRFNLNNQPLLTATCLIIPIDKERESIDQALRIGGV